MKRLVVAALMLVLGNTEPVLGGQLEERKVLLTRLPDAEELFGIGTFAGDVPFGVTWRIVRLPEPHEVVEIETSSWKLSIVTTGEQIDKVAYYTYDPAIKKFARQFFGDMHGKKLVAVPGTLNTFSAEEIENLSRNAEQELRKSLDDFGIRTNEQLSVFIKKMWKKAKEKVKKEERQAKETKWRGPANGAPFLFALIFDTITNIKAGLV